MIGIINPSGRSNLDTYNQLAVRASTNLEPEGEPFGGIIVDAGEALPSTNLPGGTGSSTSATTSAPQATSAAPTNDAAGLRPSLAALAGSLGLALLLA
jgi:hypothetical protein